MMVRRSCRGYLIHGTNFFLPVWAETGIVTVHDLSVFKFPETHPADRVRHFESNFSRSVGCARHLITDSEAIRRELIEYLGCNADRVTAVPLGVEPEFAPRSPSFVEPLLRTLDLQYGGYSLCVSTLEPRKRIGYLLQAYRRLPDALRRRYPLVLAGGSGWLSDELRTAIDGAVSEGWARYLGFLPQQQLPDLYAGAHLFTFPSLYEGFGLPVLEAMASGVPVITSNRASLPEVTGGAAILIDPDDIDGLTEAIQKGLEDDLWRARARECGLAVARRFNWERCAEQTVSVYSHVLT
jgi:alpha-1,3-rhamnosyl/mannosyltransferase